MLRAVRPALCFTMTMLLACAHATSSPPGPSPAGPPTAFSRLVDEYFEAAFAFSPSGGTAVGLHAHDRALEDLSRARVEARAAEVHAFVARLGALPEASLRPDEALDRAFLVSQARAELFDIERLQSWRENPMTYARLPGEAVDGLMKRAFAPAPERLRSVVVRPSASSWRCAWPRAPWVSSRPRRAPGRSRRAPTPPS